MSTEIEWEIFSILVVLCAACRLFCTILRWFQRDFFIRYDWFSSAGISFLGVLIDCHKVEQNGWKLENWKISKLLIFSLSYSVLPQPTEFQCVLIFFNVDYSISVHPLDVSKDFTVDGINGFSKKKKKKRRHRLVRDFEVY